MTKFTRSKLAIATAVALATGLGASSQAYASAYNATDSLWDIADTGDVLLFPYYTIKNDADGHPFTTSFTITNTNAANTVVAKFRLRDHVNSQDVLDFQLIMSPNDEVVATVSKSALNGRPQVSFPSDEKTCHVPWIDDVSNTTNTLTAPAIPSPSATDSEEGHLEVIGMYVLPSDGVITAANALDGDRAVHSMANHEANCAALSDSLGAGSTATVQAAVTAAGGGPIVIGTNPLRGAWSITSKEGGFSGGDKAVVIRDWSATGTLSAMQVPQNASTAGIIFTQLDQKDKLAYSHPHLGDISTTTTSLEAATGLGGARIVNNWSVNQDNGVGIDWIITYFTKYLWRDTNGFYGSSGTYIWPSTAYAGGAGGYDPTTIAGADSSPWTTSVGVGTSTPPNGGKCLEIPTTVYDREEKGATATVSPGSATVNLCNEASVVSFQQNNTRRSVLNSGDTVLIDVKAKFLPYGWADILVNPGDGATKATVAVGGFSYTLKSLDGDKTAAYGSITPHSVVNP